MPSRYAAARSPVTTADHGLIPSEQEVRASLETLLNAPAFNASPRNRRFLAYVVEETLAGRGSRIKAYNIALAAFDRPDDFDPLTDPIVRIEAARLRRSLEHYYLTAGQNDRIRIDMPKGSYITIFRYRDVADFLTSQTASASGKAAECKDPEPLADVRPQPSGAASWWNPGRTRLSISIAAALVAVSLALYMAYGIYEHRYSAVPDGGHSIRITQIQADPNDSEQLALARRLTYELVSQLTSHKRFLVYAPELSSALLSDSGNAEPDYVLSGFARSVSTTTRVTVLLTDMRSEHAIWATNLDADLTTARAFEFQIRASEAIIDAILNQVDPARTADPEHALRLETAAIGKPR